MRDPNVAERQKQAQTGDAPQGVAMRLNPLAGAKIMRAVIKLYAKPWDAVLREYASNALDAHVRVGQTRPVEITLPTTASPMLVVEDFGVGMTWADVENIYLEIGTSTKEADNSQIGYYGFGAKSAIMVAERFEILTRQGGYEWWIECVRNAQGIGVFRVLREQPTAAPDGVRIMIPAGGSLPFDERQVLADFFIGWPVGAVLVNGKAPTYQVANTAQFRPVKFGADVLGWVATDDVAKSFEAGTIHVSLGGVCYQLREPGYYGSYRDAYEKLRRYGRRLYVNVPLGSVEVTPSREELQYDLITNRTLTRLLDGIVAVIELEAQQRIELAPTREAAFEIYLDERRRGLWALNNLTYRGEEVPQRVLIPGTAWSINMTEYSSGRLRKEFKFLGEQKLNLVSARLDNVTLVRVADSAEANRLARKYALYHQQCKQLPDKSAVDAKIYFHTGELAADDWLTIAARTLTVADYNSIARAGGKARAALKAAAGDAEFTLVSQRNWSTWDAKPVKVADLRELVAAGEKPLLALRKGSGRFNGMLAKLAVVRAQQFKLKYSVDALFRSLANEHTVVILHTQTLCQQFDKIFPGVPDFDAALRQKAKIEYARVLELYGARSVLQQFLNYNNRDEFVRRAHVNMINFAIRGQRDGYLAQLTDPRLRDFFGELSTYSGETIKRQDTLLRWFDLDPQRDVKIGGEVQRLAAIAANYPLFAHTTDLKQEGAVLEHLIHYLNSVPLNLETGT